MNTLVDLFLLAFGSVICVGLPVACISYVILGWLNGRRK